MLYPVDTAPVAVEYVLTAIDVGKVAEQALKHLVFRPAQDRE
jgi:hypothetical protein